MSGTRSQSWEGLPDEFRIYSGALTDARILQRYLDAKPPD
jgi:hypothetical protein